MLGQGSYGRVVSRNGAAVKTFHKTSHLIQEYFAGRYLSDCPYTVKPIGINLKSLELSMEIYDTTFRNLIDHNLTKTDSLIILKDILKGLIELHDRGMVHGDIKPGNILIKRSPLKAVLGDLGFVSLAQYSKVERTAQAYREKVIHHHSAHDMFSYGIILLEIFGKVKITTQLDHKSAKPIIEENIPEEATRKLISSLLRDDYRLRPSAHKVMEKLFSQCYMISVPLTYYPPNHGISEQRLEKRFYELADKYHINHSEQGYRAIKIYLDIHNIAAGSWSYYTLVTLMILSANFGDSGFSENKILSLTKNTIDRDDIYSMVLDLLHDQLFLNELMRLD